MKETLLFLLFILVFLGVYGSLNYYVLHRMFTLFDMQRPVLFWTLFIFATLSYIIANFLDSISSNFFFQVVYYSAATWMGVVFLGFFIILIHDIISFGFKVQVPYAGYVLLMLITFVSIFALYAATQVNIRTVQLPAEKLERSVRLVQLSDIHIGTVHKSEYLHEIAQKVNALKPDLVLITGDLVDGTGQLHPEMYLGIDEIRAPVYFSLGNHEFYEGLERALPPIEKTKATVLRNKATHFKDLTIIGIDDAEDRKQVEKQLPKIKRSKGNYTILMYHRPDGMEYASKNGVDLMLSGHTHNGQIFPFNLLASMVFRYNTGLFQFGPMYLYVSPGTGTWGPPMRLGSRCEITLFELKAKK